MARAKCCQRLTSFLLWPIAFFGGFCGIFRHLSKPLLFTDSLLKNLIKVFCRQDILDNSQKEEKMHNSSG